MQRARFGSSTAAAAVAVTVLAACASGGSSGSDPGSGADAAAAGGATATSTPATPEAAPGGSATAPVEPEAPAVPEVLAFTAPTVDGGTFDGASLAGRDALLWFWAPWCPVCQREAPVVAALAAEYAGQVEVLGIGGLSGDLAAMRQFVERGGVGELTQVADTEGSVYTRFGVTSQYDIGVLTDSGAVRVVTGPLSEAELRAELDALAEG